MHTQYLSDGVDLAQWGWLTGSDGAEGMPPLRGSNLAFPRRPGQTWEQKYTDQNPLALIYVIADQIPGGGTVTDPVAQHLRNLADFRAQLWKTQGTRTLTRNITYPSGVQTTTGAFELVSFVSRRLAPSHREVTVGLNVLDGHLFAAATAAANLPATISNPGDASTRKITLVMPAAAGTLTNTTNGVSVTVDATGTTLDVWNFTSSAGIGHVTSHAGDDFWMRLDPGNNTFTWSGTGTPTISFQAAYL